MKLPYGLSNFAELRTEGYYYVDKTRYIELLEAAAEKYPVMLRPRRFGKTLFCNMLGWYYDRLCEDRFEDVFQGSYIYRRPTPRRHAYMMLTFNFSGINTETLENANEGFTSEVRRNVESFIHRYGNHFSEADLERLSRCEKPNELLSTLFQTVKDKGLEKCIYVIIDEYDHFANNLLSQGKEDFKNLVRTDGRPFYEALKKGSESVVDRIFITGVLPILLDSLTSGFNIGANLSIDARFNEMFGFTEEEIAPILDSLGGGVNREIVRTYYDGYRFSPRAADTVYNSDMILYFGLRYDPRDGYIDSMLDTNVISDYRKIRAILSIGDRALEEEILTGIVREGEVAVREIQPMFILTRKTEFLFDKETIISLLFYMGYLTIARRGALAITLTMPNLVLKSLYLDYMEYMFMKRGKIRIGSGDKLDMLEELVAGNPDRLIALTEHLLTSLSNRDYQRFDEKYIKVVMLSLLSDVNVYIPHSEYEVSADGFVDLYLQAAIEPDRSAGYFIELKYAKAKTTNKLLDKKEREANVAMRKYLDTETARTISNLRAYTLVFRKDACVRRTRLQ